MNEINGGGFVYVVKGFIWFYFLFYFDIICGIFMDYMYCVFGVLKMLMILWFDKFYCNELFNILLRIFEVDRRLM